MPSVGEFLRTMRARRKPSEIDGEIAERLVQKRRRRTPGLRREEVAELAGVSVDWYVRLEQDRADHPSSEVLDAVSRALVLTAAERRYLFRLARNEDPPKALAAVSLHPTLVAAMAAMATTPAIILGPRLDVLASNPRGESLFGGFGKGPFGRNAAWFTLCDPRGAAIFPDYRKVARDTVGLVRSGFAQRPFDREYLALVAELGARSPLFVTLWGEQHVTEKGLARKRFRHSTAGELDLDVHTLVAPDAEGQLLLFYVARDEATRRRLPKLAPT